MSRVLGSDRRYDYAIAIPARNEEARILQCLEACRESIQQAQASAVIVVLVNNCDDATAQRARSCGETLGVPVVVEERRFAAGEAHAGNARRAALDLARSFVREDGHLLTTDADSQPSASWVKNSLSLLAEHPSALICGIFTLDEAEYAALPPEVTQQGDMEGKYREIAREISNLLDPDIYNIWPFHGSASGASLGLAAAAYDRVGGLPIVPCAEDRALAQRFYEYDLPVIYADHVTVRTSCRLDGRASGGMADTIASRVAGGAYICDESVEPADMIWRRAVLRAELRAAFKNLPLRTEILRRAGLDDRWLVNMPAFTGFGAFWALIEARSPVLRRRRLLWAEMVAELPRLERLLKMARALAVPPPVVKKEVR